MRYIFNAVSFRLASPELRYRRREKKVQRLMESLWGEKKGKGVMKRIKRVMKS